MSSPKFETLHCLQSSEEVLVKLSLSTLCAVPHCPGSGRALVASQCTSALFAFLQVQFFCVSPVIGVLVSLHASEFGSKLTGKQYGNPLRPHLLHEGAVGSVIGAGVKNGGCVPLMVPSLQNPFAV